MNRLPVQKRVQIINMLVDGNSLRSTSHRADVSINTVTKLLIDTGKACQKFHEEQIVNLRSKRIQADEIWSFNSAEEKGESQDKKANDAADAWTWTAIDTDSKLIVSWFVGDRSFLSAREFMQDVASRLPNRVQLTTEGNKAYFNTVDDAFDGEIDYGQLIKIYGQPEGHGNDKRHSPAEYTGIECNIDSGRPEDKFISTSFVGKQNLTMKMHMRRFPRLTNAFSKKIERHFHALALHVVYYNFVKIHNALRVTPAMKAKLIKGFMTIEDIANMVVDDYPRKGSVIENKLYNIFKITK